jgi:lipopolysaccharide transport system permease protein
MKRKYYPDIIYELVLTDFKLKYNESVLGYIWSLLNPLSQFIALMFVFTVIFKTDEPNFPLLLLLGIITWGFFVECSTSSMTCLVGKSYLLKNIRIPKWALIVSSSLVAVLTFILNFCVFLLFSLIFNQHYGILALGFIPMFILLYMFSISVGFALSSLYVRFRDLTHIYHVIMLFGFWLTPIVYPIKLVPVEYLGVYLLNPVSRIILLSQDFLLKNTLVDTVSLQISVLMVCVTFIASLLVYKRVSINVGDYL